MSSDFPNPNWQRYYMTIVSEKGRILCFVDGNWILAMLSFSGKIPFRSERLLRG